MTSNTHSTEHNAKAAKAHRKLSRKFAGTGKGHREFHRTGGNCTDGSATNTKQFAVCTRNLPNGQKYDEGPLCSRRQCAGVCRRQSAKRQNRVAIVHGK